MIAGLGRLSTAIQRIDYPIHNGAPNPYHGKYFIVGSIPAACYDKTRNDGHGGSFIYDTEADAGRAIELAGVERYQLADCSWNKPA